MVSEEVFHTLGDAFYLLDSDKFRKNYLELKDAFSEIYPNFNIAYSYKTNYTPKLCKIVNELGGYAEVVSDMELTLALRAGVSPEKIIWNGPCKNAEKLEEFLLTGGTVNIDAAYETELARQIAARHPEKQLNIGIRCNFDISDSVVSRFGFDTSSEDFREALDMTQTVPNIYLAGLQCHFATRSLATWPSRVTGILQLLDDIGIIPDKIDLGGGLYGKMADSLKSQFTVEIPTYEQYAEATMPPIAEYFKDKPKKPQILIEPGTAVAGDCMRFFARVISIKEVRGKAIATVLGSMYNINPTLNGKNPPITVHNTGGEAKEYTNLDFGGFTCIESDYLYRNYSGPLAVGDYAEFGNVGSYSIVLKPPFILPNFPIADISGGGIEIIKQGECFDDIFHTFVF